MWLSPTNLRYSPPFFRSTNDKSLGYDKKFRSGDRGLDERSVSFVLEIPIDLGRRNIPVNHRKTEVLWRVRDGSSIGKSVYQKDSHPRLVMSKRPNMVKVHEDIYHEDIYHEVHRWLKNKTGTKDKNHELVGVLHGLIPQRVFVLSTSTLQIELSIFRVI